MRRLAGRFIRPLHANQLRSARTGEVENQTRKKKQRGACAPRCIPPGRTRTNELHVLASYISLELMNRELLLGDNIFHQIAD